MSIFGAVGDLHIGGVNNILGVEGLNLQMQTLQKIKDQMVKADVKHIILLGDIFDSPEPEALLYEVFLLFLNKNNDVFWYIIGGNHDHNNKNKVSLRLPNIMRKLAAMQHVNFYLEPKLERIDGVLFYFMPWPHTKSVKTKEQKINIAHFTKKGALLNDTGRRAKEGEEITPSQDYWIIGDLHGFQEYDKIKYPGTPYQIEFVEKPDKIYYIFDAKRAEKKLHIKFTTKKAPSYYILKQISVNNIKELDRIDFKEEHTYYRLVYKFDMNLPDNWLHDHPQVVRSAPFNNSKEKNSLLNNEIGLEADLQIQVRPTHMLGKYLIQNGLSKKYLSVAHKITERAIRRLGL